ncbi:MAG: hypothetical protein ACE5G7_01390 [Candidatus Hydrothermarchaeaceae archaeon]
MDLLFTLSVALHTLLGVTLITLASRAYLKTRYRPMLFLALGFFFIVLGDTIFEDLGVHNQISEIFEIMGLGLLIYAVWKS